MAVTDTVGGSSAGIAMCHIAIILAATDVALWHEVAVRFPPDEGQVTAGKPTFRAVRASMSAFGRIPDEVLGRLERVLPLPRRATTRPQLVPHAIGDLASVHVGISAGPVGVSVAANGLHRTLRRPFQGLRCTVGVPSGPLRSH